MLHVNASGLSKADRALRRFSAQLADLRPFWRELGEHLADTARRAGR